jgi:hypothetical protein
MDPLDERSSLRVGADDDFVRRRVLDLHGEEGLEEAHERLRIGRVEHPADASLAEGGVRIWVLL